MSRDALGCVVIIYEWVCYTAKGSSDVWRVKQNYSTSLDHLMLPTLKLTEVNKNLICPLCEGYLIDASTIVECLHSFCRSCIVHYLDSSFNCPVCHTEVHKTRPLVNVRPDPTLQDIVYKIVPDLYENECQSRKLFQEHFVMNEGEVEKDEPDMSGISHIADNSDTVYVTLDHHQRNVLKSNQRKVFPTRYVRCSKKVPVRVLKKLIQLKFGVKKTHEIEISRCDEVLNDCLNLKEISRIYGLHGKTGPIDLKFDISPKSSERDSVSLQANMSTIEEKQKYESAENGSPVQAKKKLFNSSASLSHFSAM